MSELWHFTCADHGYRGLGRAGKLRPWRQPFLDDRELVWAATLDWPDRDALGLTASVAVCDRTAYRYRIVEPEGFVPWSAWWPRRVDPTVVSMLAYPPRRPDLWWVSEAAAAAELAP